MKANELMIGDWIRYGNKFGIVKAIKTDECLILVSCNGNDELIWETLDNIESIPLTPEILEKNGFTKGYGVWIIYRHPSIKWFVLYKKEFGYAISVGESEVSINYVHELQHALKLCGIEKTIEL